MSQEFKNRQKLLYHVDTFNDESGTVHTLVLCGNLVNTFENSNFSSKQLSIGLVLIKGDEDSDIDIEKGKEIAFSRTGNPNSRLGKLTTCYSNMLSVEMARTILRSEAEFIKNAPHKFIKLLGKNKALIQHAKKELQIA